jgi:gamma-glutamyltranspeptidase/glutathione hydrolase
MSVLERGGNAFDAATAGAFVLHVAEPDQNGLGGEVPILLWSAGERKVRVICGQGPTPIAATPAAFRRLGLELIPGSGALAACVPGAFDAWMLLLRDFGTWSLSDALGYAIGYAEKGVPVSDGLSRRIAKASDHFRAHWPTSVEVYLGDGVPGPGSRLRNRAVADTLSRIVREAEGSSSQRERQIDAARAAWKSGFVAEIASRWLRDRPIRDLEGRSDMALLDAQDWAAFSAELEDPVSTDFQGVSFYKASAWSQGPVLLQVLQLLAHVDITSLRHNSSAYIHAVVEALKLAFADREAHYGDPKFSDVPIDTLCGPEYARDRAGLIGDRASVELRPGSPAGRTPRLPSYVSAGRNIGETRSEGHSSLATAGGGDTAHISVMDRSHNVVSAMPSGGWLQSSPVISVLGFPLGTRAQMLWLEQGLPNSLAPGKRPRTTLSPTLVLADGEPLLACGSPGGDAQDQWGLEFVLGHLTFGLPAQEAADAPTFQSLHAPSSFWPRASRPAVLQVEAGLDHGVVADLRARGHVIEEIPAWSQGWACAVRVTPDGFFTAGASRRGRSCFASVR